MSKATLGNTKNVELAGLRKKYNRAKRQVELLTQLWHESESHEIAEQLFAAEKRLTDCANRLSNFRKK
jgi:hypothetical protein